MSGRSFRKIAFAFALLCCALASAADRTFDFNYAFIVTGVPAGVTAKIWIPLASSDPAQDVIVTDQSLPHDATITIDASGLNRMYFVTASPRPDGTIPLLIRYHVTRHEIHSLPVRGEEDISADLQPNQLVPIGGRPAQLVDSASLPTDDTAKARALFDVVYNYLAYSKERPGWGRGDVLWACDSRSGNCSDFHSLFLSLSRTNHLPAKIEFGFIIPPPERGPKVANYHCWAYFLPGAGSAWLPVDISMAKSRPALKENYFSHLDANRFGISTGRDLTLSPPQGGPPVNFFVYPYVEVGGEIWPIEKIVRDFSIDTPATQPAS